MQTFNCYYRELEKEFGKFGPITKITVVLDGKTGRSRGFAFVTFDKVEDATEARNAMADSGKEILSFKIIFSQFQLQNWMARRSAWTSVSLSEPTPPPLVCTWADPPAPAPVTEDPEEEIITETDTGEDHLDDQDDDNDCCL